MSSVRPSDDSTPGDIEVIVSPSFKKALKRLSARLRDRVDDEIEVIIANPEIGEQKKGNLSYLRVHKFKADQQLYLLGYCWKSQQLQLYLLQLGSHENYYRDASRRSQQDKKFLE